MSLPRLTVERVIFDRHPSYVAHVLYASDLSWADAHAVDYSARVLRDSESRARQRLELVQPAEHPHLAAWRSAFQSYGINPNRYPNGAESLLKRVLKQRELPILNAGVNLYNAVSLDYLLPIGGEDRAGLVSDLRLTHARGNEPFVAVESGTEVTAFPEKGEPVWVDAEGVTCRRWNHRQCRRTQLTAAVHDAYFVLDRLQPFPLEQLEQAAHRLGEHLRRVSPRCQLEHETLSA